MTVQQTSERRLIKTAPKDGTRVDAWYRRTFSDAWPDFGIPVEASFDGGSWVMPHNKKPLKPQPTHWSVRA